MSVKIFVSFCLEPIKLIELGGTSLKVTIFLYSPPLSRNSPQDIWHKFQNFDYFPHAKCHF